MSHPIKTVFHEYTRLRMNGLDATEAVRTLHPYVQELDDAARSELAQNLRAWENQRTEKISLLDRERLVNAAETRKSQETIQCPSCERLNNLNDAICYACGSLLNTRAINATDVLPQSGSLNDQCLSDQSILLLTPRDEGEALMLRPQMGTGRITFGRSVDRIDADVNLDAYGADGNGVSRLHATLIYDDVSQTVALMDLGSTNGTSINGDRLLPNDRRTLRHGDEIRFGNLYFTVAIRAENN